MSKTEAQGSWLGGQVQLEEPIKVLCVCNNNLMDYGAIGVCIAMVKNESHAVL